MSLIESLNKVRRHERACHFYAKFMLAIEYGILSEVASRSR